MSKRPVISVSGKGANMQSWYEEKCKRALEELSLLSAAIHRSGDELSEAGPARRWKSTPICSTLSEAF